MPFKSSRLRLILRILLALLLTLSAMSAGVFWLLQRNPQALAEHYIEQIAASTGLTITVESVNVALLPLPSLAVSNATVTGKGLSFTVAYATLRPDFLALLRGELLPRNITLLRPQFQGQVPVALANSLLIPAAPAPKAPPGGTNTSTGADAVSGKETGASARQTATAGNPAQVAAPTSAKASAKSPAKTSGKATPAPPSLPLQSQTQPSPAAAETPPLAASENQPSPVPRSSEGETSLQAWIAQLASGSGTQTSLLPGRFRLAISQGEVNLTGSDQTSLTATGLQCDIETEETTRLQGNLFCATAVLQPEGQPASRFDNLTIAGKTNLSAPLSSTPQLVAKGTLQLPIWLARLNFSVSLKADELGWSLANDLEAELRKDEVLLPAHITGTVGGSKGNNETVSLENLRLLLGPDEVSVNGTLHMGGPDMFLVEGRLLIKRASLTEWLGFARNLAPGLQVALDEVTLGSLDFSVDGKGLRVPHIDVTASGSRFLGSGGVASWAKPELVLDLKAETVNLGRAIPESVGIQPAEPRYGHGPLTPMPGTPVVPGEVGLDYNIRLGATLVNYGPIVINDALVVIKQGLVDQVTHFEDTLLLVDGTLYGGSVKGDTILGGSPDTPYAIRLHMRDVNGENLAKALPVMPVSGGKLRGDVDIMSQGRELDMFLGKLRGTVTVRAEKGQLRPPSNTSSKASLGAVNFKTLDVSLKARTAAWDQGRLGLEGQWNATLADEGIDADVALNGRLWFSGDGSGGGNMDFQGLPGTLKANVSAEKSFPPEGLQAQISGKFSCQAARNQLSVSEAHANMLGADITGSAQVGMGKDGLGWQGKISALIPDSTKTLRLLGAVSPNVPHPLRRVELDTTFKGDAASLSLTEFNAKVDQKTLSGSVALDWRKELALRFKLSMPQLDLDRYMGDKAGGSGESPKSKKSPESKPWDLRFMKAFSAEGEAHVGLLTLWKLHTQDLRLKVKMDNGNLRYESLGGKFYGSSLAAHGELQFNKGVSFANSLTIDNFDLAAASKDRGGSSALGGQTTIHSEMDADLTASGQIPAHLNGKWRFSVRNGFYQSRDKDGQLKGKATRFDASGSSGTVTHGLAKSGDFYLKGQDMTVTGGGWVDLNNETLDCNFTVNMKNLPEFPLRMYGSLDNSKTSIGAGKLLLNTIGGLTMGVVDVLGSVVEGTWKLFR